MIGQFGVGFYSSFMVADRITLLTRRAGEATATLWESTGDGYTLESAERDGAGMGAPLDLKPVDPEDGLADYTQPATLRDTVKKYSEFVAYPIRLGADTLNSMKEIWARSKESVFNMTSIPCHKPPPAPISPVRRSRMTLRPSLGEILLGIEGSPSCGLQPAAIPRRGARVSTKLHPAPAHRCRGADQRRGGNRVRPKRWISTVVEHV